MTLPTASDPFATHSPGLIGPAGRRYAITAEMIADMLANDSNIRTEVSGGREYIPRALKCETEGVIDFVIMEDGAERAVTGYPLTLGINPDGGMHRITRFTGTGLWGIL
jgi:hypothetical protein